MRKHHVPGRENAISGHRSSPLQHLGSRSSGPAALSAHRTSAQVTMLDARCAKHAPCAPVDAAESARGTGPSTRRREEERQRVPESGMLMLTGDLDGAGRSAAAPGSEDQGAVAVGLSLIRRIRLLQASLTSARGRTPGRNLPLRGRPPCPGTPRAGNVGPTQVPSALDQLAATVKHSCASPPRPGGRAARSCAQAWVDLGRPWLAPLSSMGRRPDLSQCVAGFRNPLAGGPPTSTATKGSPRRSAADRAHRSLDRTAGMQCRHRA